VSDCDQSASGSLDIPSTYNGLPVTSIGVQAFQSCTSLSSITIPDSVTSIGRQAFDSCSGLTSITIPDSVTSIGASTFFYCTSLTNISIPDSVTSIGLGAFNFCTSLTSITIPDSVTSIHLGTFYSSGVSSLSFSSPLLEAAEAERDARPTQTAYDAVLAERDAAIAEKASAEAAQATAEASLANAREARTGSTVIDVADVVIDGAATQVANITLTVEQTSDVSDWSSAATSNHTIQLNAPDGASFYRFKMTE